MTTPLERATREVLRAGAEGLDGRVRSRLNRARQAALEEMVPSGRWSRTPFLPLVAAAGAAFVAVVLWLPGSGSRPAAPVVAASTAAITDAELLGMGGEGLLDEDPTLFALAAAEEGVP